MLSNSPASVDGVRNGMVVRSADGVKLGKVIAVRENEFTVEKGFFFPRDFHFRTTDIASLKGDEIVLAVSSEFAEDQGEGFRSSMPEEPSSKSPFFRSPSETAPSRRDKGGLSARQPTDRHSPTP